MRLPRRDFMKLFGSSLGSMLAARYGIFFFLSGCMTSCYTPVPSPAPATRTPLTPENPRTLLRLCWLRLGELAGAVRNAAVNETGGWEDNPLGARMISEHRSALDNLAAAGAITAPVADLVQEAYEAAVYHVWRLNVPMTCYKTALPNYAPDSADSLVAQAEVLARIADGTPIMPATVAKVRAALEHDLAFYALTDDGVQALYDALRAEYSGPEETMPSFEQVELTLTADAKAAAEFLIDLLSRP
jgi:hypothetical protein